MLSIVNYNIHNVLGTTESNYNFAHAEASSCDMYFTVMIKVHHTHDML